MRLISRTFQNSSESAQECLTCQHLSKSTRTSRRVMKTKYVQRSAGLCCHGYSQGLWLGNQKEICASWENNMAESSTNQGHKFAKKCLDDSQVSSESRTEVFLASMGLLISGKKGSI